MGGPNFFRGGPESKYFRMCGPRGLGETKDVYMIRKQHLYWCTFYEQMCLVRYNYSKQAGGLEELVRILKFFEDKIRHNWCSPMIRIDYKCSSDMLFVSRFCIFHGWKCLLTEIGSAKVARTWLLSSRFRVICCSCLLFPWYIHSFSFMPINPLNNAKVFCNWW